MHEITYSYRRIAVVDLPAVRELDGTTRPATDAELRNMGIVHVTDDLYACIEQHHSDGIDDTTGARRWAICGEPLPGDILSEGLLNARHANLPSDVRPRIMRADIIRSTAPNIDVRDVAKATLTDVQAAFEENVGTIDAAFVPAIDPSNTDAVFAEVRRMAEHPELPAERVRIPMADIADTHVVEAENVVPHTWAGEPRR